MGWENPFVLALQVAISALDALPDARALKDAVRECGRGSPTPSYSYHGAMGRCGPCFSG
jgi:hypothetical protein